MQTHKGGTRSNQAWLEGDIESCTVSIARDMEAAVIALTHDEDSTGYVAKFLASQAELLLALVRWLCDNYATSVPANQEYLRLCATIMRSVVTCLKPVLAFENAIQSPGRLVRGLLGALVMAVEFVYMSGKEDISISRKTPHGTSRGDVFADVALVGLGFLPVLCSLTQKEEYSNLAVAAINLLIKGFLAPQRWFPIVQRDFPLQLALSRMRLHKGTEFPRVMLNLCLSLSCARVGGELLVAAGFFTHLMQLSQELQVADDSSIDMEGPFAVWQKHKRQQEGLWGFGVSVVTALVRSCGDEDVAEKAYAYFAMEKDRMLAALRAPISFVDPLGRKKAKLQHPHTSLAALQQTQRIVALICELSAHYSPWIRCFEDSILQYGNMTVHLLAFIAKEGSTRPGGLRIDGSVSCQPLHREERSAHVRPCIVGSNCAWFSVAAKGCILRDKQRHSSSSRSPSPTRTSSPMRLSSSPSSATMLVKTSGSGGTQPPCTEYSDQIAMNVYKLAAVLLRFLCKQAQQAVSRVSADGPPDFLHFPSLPAPDILHNLQVSPCRCSLFYSLQQLVNFILRYFCFDDGPVLNPQDQAMAIIIDVCVSRSGKALDPQVRDFCLLLMGILEKSLCLEICLWRTCDISPVPLRTDDFSREHKALIAGMI